MGLSSTAQEMTEETNQLSYVATLDLFSVLGGPPDFRFETSLNDRTSISMRAMAFEGDSLHATLGVLSYRLYPIQKLGEATKGFYIGPRLFKGALNEIPEGTSAWREVVRGIGVGVETGYQFKFDFGLVVDLGIGLNMGDQVIQFLERAIQPASHGILQFLKRHTLSSRWCFLMARVSPSIAEVIVNHNRHI